MKMIYFWVVSIEDDFGFIDAFWRGFCWSIPWIHLYKLRRTHRRAVVAVVVAVAVAAVVSSGGGRGCENGGGAGEGVR